MYAAGGLYAGAAGAEGLETRPGADTRPAFPDFQSGRGDHLDPLDLALAGAAAAGAAGAGAGAAGAAGALTVWPLLEKIKTRADETLLEGSSRVNSDSTLGVQRLTKGINRSADNSTPVHCRAQRFCF